MTLSHTEQLKRAAAERAVALVESGMRLGLGTGSTARHVLDVIGERLREGSLTGIVGVPTSTATYDYAQTLGIPLGTLDDHPRLDLAIDGADEVDPHLQLIKGLGGALLWEKIVESASSRLVIVVDESKLVARLGDRTPLPVEVVPFGWRSHVEFFHELGAEPTSQPGNVTLQQADRRLPALPLDDVDQPLEIGVEDLDRLGPAGITGTEALESRRFDTLSGGDLRCDHRRRDIHPVRCRRQWWRGCAAQSHRHVFL